MRKLCAAVLSVVLISTSAFAASNTQNLLAPGKPAGVRDAQTGNQVIMIVAGVAIAGMILALASGGNGGSSAGNNPGGVASGTTTGTV